MAHHDRYTSLILGTFGLYIAFEGWRLQVGTFSHPKAGFMVFGAGLILFSLSMLLLVNAYLHKKRLETRPVWKDVAWIKGAKVMGAMFLYALIFRQIGFILSTFLLLLFLLKGIEPQRWRVALVISALTVIVCHLLFVVFLEVNFPAGIWIKMIF